MLAAGLEGIEQGYTLNPPLEENIGAMSEAWRREMDIQQLPGDLNEAIKAAEDSALVQRALGDHVFFKLLENKREEWAAYRAHVTNYELSKYLPIL